MNVALKLAVMHLSTTAYPGLAVVGRGGIRAFFSDPALAALAVVTVALTAVASVTGATYVRACGRTGATAGCSRSSS